MTAPTAPPGTRPGRLGWLAGPLTLTLLAGVGVLLGAPSAATTLAATTASAFVPADATRGKVTLRLGDAEAPAELSDARLPSHAVPGAFSATAVDASAATLRSGADAAWYREAVVPVDGSTPARLRLRLVDGRGVWLVAQDWGDLGLTFDGLLELPADVHAGQTWSGSGAAQAGPAAGALRFSRTSTAAAPEDPARAAAGCLQVGSRTELSGAARRTWDDDELWCPGLGVVGGRGELAGTPYAVTSGGAPTPVTDADLAPAAWDTDGLAGWRVGAREVVAGDPTSGFVPAGSAGAPGPGQAPVVTASGVVVFPSQEGGDLVGLVARGPDLWTHWWARPGGTVTSLGVLGSLVVAPTTAHRVSAYRAGRTLAWDAPLDDVVVAPPLAVGDAVAVATVSGTLTLLDARTGATRWSARVGAGVHGALASGEGVLVTADASSTLTAWDVSTGQRRWQVDDATSPSGTSLGVADGQVVVAAAGTITAYAVASGRQTWTRSPGLGLGAVSLVGDQVWLSLGDDLHAWSAADGDQLWTRVGAQPLTSGAAGCQDSRSSLGLARQGDQLLALAVDGSQRASWTLPRSRDDVLTATCRGAGVDLTTYAPDGSRPLAVLRLAAP